MPNRLADETSPYLQQHANNPVDWYPWGEEALARAKREDKPILLSIGYSACHWCHVMERESFENEETARLMNGSYVCVKVDREERPDLDEIYMRATLALNQGQGGWPMTVFLTPEQKPFFAGTYYPPEDRWGRPGFRTLLTRLAELWQGRRADVSAQAARLVEHLVEMAGVSAPGALTVESLRAACAQYRRDFDPMWGGFGQAPKFPPANGLELLLRVWRRFGDAEALAMVQKTLEAMAQGGMYDQIGGGFARYSTDERWLVPHFEKMLYDNALLTRAYLEGWQATGRPLFRRIAVEVLDYVLAEMTHEAGGFFSATDADSEGEEGKFFVWEPEEVRAVCGGELARRLCVWLDITEGGNWEGKSIPNTPRSLAEVARELGIAEAELEASIAEGRAKLYAARRKRVPPARDDKILAGWNGMMIAAFAEGYRALRDPRYLAAATRAADFLLASLARGDDGALWRTWRDGRTRGAAVLEDYAWLCSALVDLYEAGGERRFLDRARAIAGRIERDFLDAESGAFFSTGRDHEPLLVRQREGMDGATPSPNAVAAESLARLSFHLGDEKLRKVAERAVSAYGQLAGRHGRAFARSLMVVDLLAEGPVELALAGAPGDPGREALALEVGRTFVPNRIVAPCDPAQPTPDLPLTFGKSLVGGRAALYVCKNFACAAPIVEPAEVRPLLAPPAAPETQAPAGGALPGRATAQATLAHTARVAPHGRAPLGSTGLTVSKLGFGCYRVGEGDPEHAEALAMALGRGCNLIDTSTNYGDGGSERVVGEVLGELVRARSIDRAAVVVVSKIGYVQGQNMRLARQREGSGRPFPEMVKYADGCWHCMHPEFLADQLQRSLQRLGLATLDVCLIHNPEYFFSDAVHHGRTDVAAVRDEFYGRLANAFEYFEREVAAGRLGCYGVSSNSAAMPISDAEETSLERMLDAAQRAGGDGHHFRVLQLPFNLIESGAALEKKHAGKSPLELAAARGIAVLANRPLNAIRGRGMVRLADPGLGSEGIDDARQRQTRAWAGEALDPALPEARRTESLSRRALWVLASTPGLSSVLLGMRRPPHVEDAMAVLSWEPLQEPLSALGRL